MKVGVTVDEVRGSVYVLGKYDFYTRQFELADDVAHIVQVAESASVLSQRILSSLYNSNGRFINPEDLEALKCAVAKLAPVTPEAAPAKPRKLTDSAPASKSESRRLSVQQA